MWFPFLACWCHNITHVHTHTESMLTYALSNYTPRALIVTRQEIYRFSPSRPIHARQMTSNSQHVCLVSVCTCKCTPHPHTSLDDERVSRVCHSQSSSSLASHPPLSHRRAPHPTFLSLCATSAECEASTHRCDERMSLQPPSSWDLCW